MDFYHNYHPRWLWIRSKYIFLDLHQLRDICADFYYNYHLHWLWIHNKYISQVYLQHDTLTDFYYNPRLH